VVERPGGGRREEAPCEGPRVAGAREASRWYADYKQTGKSLRSVEISEKACSLEDKGIVSRDLRQRIVKKNEVNRGVFFDKKSCAKYVDQKRQCRE
jgi:hypothetical protein